MRLLLENFIIISHQIHIRRSLSPKLLYINSLKMSTSESTDSPSPSGLLKVFKNSPKRLKRIRFLGQVFESHGFELRIAGGAVRDILNDKEPTDIDFATTAKPDETLNLMKSYEHIVRIITTEAGKRHGTVAVKFKEVDIDLKRIKLSGEEANHGDKIQKNLSNPEYDNEPPYEITTLRRDTTTDGRHAEVEFVNDWNIDAERRDLTINAMFLTLKDGSLIDYFGGESDLKNGIVRFVGDSKLRIQEDYLRILRFFRFWARYGQRKAPDDETMATIRDNLEGLEKISGERIWTEIKKILSDKSVYDVILLMLRNGVFNHIGFKHDVVDNYVSKVSQELRNVLDNLEAYHEKFLCGKSKAYLDSYATKKTQELFPALKIATLVIDEDMFWMAHKKLKFSNLERDSILSILKYRDVEKSLKDLKFQLVSVKRHEQPVALQTIRSQLIYKGQFSTLEAIEDWNIPEFPLKTNLVISQFSKFKIPNFKIKSVIEKLRTEWAENDYKSTDVDLHTRMQEIVEELSKETK